MSNQVEYFSDEEKKNKKVIPPHIVVTGPSFTIYGEIHNDIDNRFYENLYKNFSHNNDYILLEKTTNSEILEKEKKTLNIIPKTKIDVYLNTIGGSEWLYTKSLIDNKQFEPIDIRIENGYPSQIEIYSLDEFAEENPIMFLGFLHETIKNIDNSKEKLNRPCIKEKYNKFLPIIHLQIKLFAENLKKKVIDIDIVNNIKTNIQRLGVLLVDAHIIDIISENEKKTENGKKHLHFFVGARHALNLYDCLKSLKMYNLQIIKTKKGEKIEPLEPVLSESETTSFHGSNGGRVRIGKRKSIKKKLIRFKTLKKINKKTKTNRNKNKTK